MSSSFLHLTRLIFRNRFIGIWDSVGAIWREEKILGYEDSYCPGEDCVEEAVHALALHENRDHYKPNLWNVGKQINRIAQVCQIPCLLNYLPQPVHLFQLWFPGAHSQVGGGTSRRKLSDIPLCWIVVSRPLISTNKQHWKYLYMPPLSVSC